MKKAISLYVLVVISFSHVTVSFAQGQQRGAVAGGIYKLWEQAVKDEEGWILPPKRNKKKIGEKTVTVRYRKAVREVAVYEEETKEVMVRSNDDSGEGAGAMVKRTIKVRGKQKGTEKQEYLVRDPNGPISRQEKRTVYGPGGDDFWGLGQLGTNAMAAAVLLQTEVPGVDVAMEPSISLMVELVKNYGMPDLTWDLSWLIVLFSHSTDTEAQALVPELTEKLMRGQWTSGQAAGLWGPVAIQPEYLGYLYQKFWLQSQEYQKVKAKVGEDSKPSSIKKLNDATVELDAVKKELDQYTWFYGSATPRRTWVPLTDEWDETRGFVLPPEYPFHTRTADLESTWLALTALRVAAKKNLIVFPEPQPVLSTGGLQKPPAPNPQQVLVQAGNGVVRNQHSSGAFHEMNFHGPAKGFEDLPGIPGVPLKKGASFPELDSPVTLISTAQGLACLSIIGDVLGPSAYRQYGRSMLGAKQVLDNKIEEVLAGSSPHMGENAMGMMAFAMAVMDSGPDMEAAPKDLRAQVREKVRSLYHPKSSGWSMKDAHGFLSPVWFAQANVLPQRSTAYDDFSEPFVRRKFETKGRHPAHALKDLTRNHQLMTSEATTAAAIWILSGGEPVAEVVPEPTGEEPQQLQ